MSNKLALTRQALESPAQLSEVFELEAFRNNFILNYLKTTGKDNGEMVFEREKILFMKAVTDNPQLQKCDRFSIYSSMVELGASGMTLNEGIAGIIPYGGKAQFQIFWKGRLEQMSQMPEINFVNPPQVVYQLDEFEYELGEVVRIIKHKPSKDPDREKSLITHVYVILDTIYGKKHYLMTRGEVLKIRDNYSQGYKSYLAECKKQGVEPGNRVIKKMKGKDGRGDWELPLDPPFWVTSEDEAFKKTLIKRVYKSLPKTPRLKALDAKLAGHYDKEDGTIEETHDIDYGIEDETQETAQAAPAPKVETKTAGIGDESAQVRQMKAEAAPLTAAMKEKGQISETPKTRQKAKPAEKPAPPPPAQEPTRSDVDQETGEYTPANVVSEEENPAAGLPELPDNF
jgi:recombinational DNA repair protein RecT